MIRFALAKYPTPLWNTPNFSRCFAESLRIDKELEMIALKDTKFQLLHEVENDVWSVTTDEYPGEIVYTDLKFLHLCSEEPTKREINSFNEAQALEKMENALNKNLPYLWGGNCSQGIPELLTFYPPSKQLSQQELDLWMMKGLDCTGLLYEATNGSTPRNSSQLVTYGEGLSIENLSPRALADLLRPLDLIVWCGHVIIVFDGQTAIESRGGKGMMATPLVSRLEEVFTERKPRNDPMKDNATSFVVRRGILQST